MGGPDSSLTKTGPGATGTANSRMIHRPRSAAERGRNTDAPRYRQAKETKCGEKTVRKSERLVVPLIQGNHPRDPGEGRRRHLMNRWRETCQVRRDLITCPRNDNGSRNSPGTALTWRSRTCASHRHRMDAHSPWPYTQGRGRRRGRTNRGKIRGQPGGQPPEPPRPRQIRHVMAPPVRRVHIPKAGSPNETRPLGIPTYEDKILQRAVLMVLEPVYETDFLDVSHGFRPGRGAHGALDSLWKQEMKLGGDWIVDVDLRNFSTRSTTAIYGSSSSVGYAMV